MTAVRAPILALITLLTVIGCERAPAPPTTAPATQAATKPTTKPKELTYVDVIRTNYPKLPATQPLGVPVDLNDAGKFILDVPVYLCPNGDLWITHANAQATQETTNDAMAASTESADSDDDDPQVAAWWSFFGTALSLVAAIGGAMLGPYEFVARRSTRRCVTSRVND